MKRILIIESDLQTAQLEKDYLELSDFKVMIATDAESGKNMAMTGEYDLLILGISLPELDGFEICREFREKYLEPVIFVTDRDDDCDKIHGLGLGADDYITKPFSPSELVARVKAHMNRYVALRESTAILGEGNEKIVIGELEVDRTARRVVVRGQEVHLTTKEFELLYFLAQNPNRVFTKDELFQHIWGTEAVGDTATVTVHIKKLREKIERDASLPEYIQTIWGAGYRFRARVHV